MDIAVLKAAGIKLVSIDERIHVVQGLGRGRSPFSNSILVLDKRKALIDTGCVLPIIEKLMELVRFDLVLNTHSHPDHTGGNWIVRERSEARIVVPEDEQDSIGSMDKLSVRMMGAHLGEIWKREYLPITGYRDFTPDGVYGDGAEFDLGALKLVAVHTPGHLRDHYCFFEPASGTMIGADIDLSPFGPWYGNAESNIDAFKASVDRLRDMPIATYISGHAKPVHEPYLGRRLKAYLSVFDERQADILALIPEGSWITLEELVYASPIYHWDYKSHIDWFLCNGETHMIGKHLYELVRQGAVIQSPDGFAYRRT
jgi:glyoxylase-like metal-dependent hydrolase (beta-lactamase superfamily II)